MVKGTPRLLLIFSSLLLILGGAMHAAAFKRAVAVLDTSSMVPFFANSFKVLWLIDSTTMFILAGVFGLVAIRPSAATRPVVMLLALIPAAIAVVLYVFLGSFFAAHILIVTAAAVFIAGLQFPGAPKVSQVA